MDAETRAEFFRLAAESLANYTMLVSVLDAAIKRGVLPSGLVSGALDDAEKLLRKIAEGGGTVLDVHTSRALHIVDQARDHLELPKPPAS